jgi:transcriptional regulator with XRE-family HTH domain
MKSERYSEDAEVWERVRVALMETRAALGSVEASHAGFIDAMSKAVVDQNLANTKWAVLARRLRENIAQSRRALQALDQEIESISHAQQLPGIALELVRHAADRSRRAVQEFKDTWDEVDELIVRLVVDKELSKPLSEADWSLYWGRHAHLAKAVIEGVSGTAGPWAEKDVWALRLKYEKGMTQQQIADLLNLAQSTVAVRLGRAEELIGRSVAYDTVRRSAVDEGYQVTDHPYAARLSGTDLLAEKAGTLIAIEVKIAMEPEHMRQARGSVRGVIARERDRIERILKSAPGVDRIQFVAVAVYFRRDGDVVFYDLRDFDEATREDPFFLIDPYGRDRPQPYTSLDAFVREHSREEVNPDTTE